MGQWPQFICFPIYYYLTYIVYMRLPGGWFQISKKKLYIKIILTRVCKKFFLFTLSFSPSKNLCIDIFICVYLGVRILSSFCILSLTPLFVPSLIMIIYSSQSSLRSSSLRGVILLARNYERYKFLKK